MFADEAYRGSQADCSFALGLSFRGLQLRWSGYRASMGPWLEATLASLSRPADSSALALAKEQVSVAFRNALHQPPYQEALALLEVYLDPGRALPQELLPLVESVTLEEVNAHWVRLWAAGSSNGTRALAYGNLNRADSESWMQNITAGLQLGSDRGPDPSVVRLGQGQWLSQGRPSDTQESNSATVAFFQVAPVRDREKAMMLSLLSLLISEPCFDFLRTQRQLGYLGQVAGLQVVVQGSSAANKQHEAIEAFLDDFAGDLDNLTNSAFEAARNVVLAQLNEPLLTLEKAAGDAWSQVLLGSLDWQHVASDSKIVSQITLEQLKAFYGEFVEFQASPGAKSTRRKISVSLFGADSPIVLPEGSSFADAGMLPPPAQREQWQKVQSRYAHVEI